MKLTKWHVITSEYPPQVGGVSDYTKLITAGLALAGDEVHVWCPPNAVVDVKTCDGGAGESDGVIVHREFGRFAPTDLRRVGRKLDQFPAPRRLLVQWVPQGYGYRSINLPFCLWLWQRAKLKGDRVELMVHEPFLAFAEGSRKQDLAAAMHRLMVITLLSAASHVWVSIPDWEVRLRPFALGGNKPFGWLPVPSTIPVVDDPAGINTIRVQHSFPDAPLVGHFGAYDRYMIELMMELLPSLLRGHDELSVILIGKGSQELIERFIEQDPKSASRAHATGSLAPKDISRHISACDLMLQPYQDGVSGRRTSVMAALAHGIPVITTTGKATEGCWAESEAVKFTKVGDIAAMVEAAEALLADSSERGRLSAAGRALYEERFDVKRTIATLRETAL